MKLKEPSNLNRVLTCRGIQIVELSLLVSNLRALIISRGACINGNPARYVVEPVNLSFYVFQICFILYSREL